MATVAAALLFGILPPTRGAETSGGRITQLSLSNARPALLFDSVPGNYYQVQRTRTLGNRWWVDLGPALLANDRSTSAELSEQPGSAFFRVLEFPAPHFWYDWNYYPQSTHLVDWGLGAIQDSYTHVDRLYEWFIDQADTGPASGNNCGPSSVTMACRWHTANFPRTAGDAREWSAGWRGTGWWYTSDIINYLNLNQIPHSTASFTGVDVLKNASSNGYLAILCLNTAYLQPNNASEQRVGRFYSYASGHFLVVKGCREASGVTHLEAYDPNTWHQAYADGSPKGRNRHYTATDVAAAITNWWNFAILLPPPGALANTAPDFAVTVDPAKIPHQWGR